MVSLLHFIYLPSFEAVASGLLDDVIRQRIEQELMENPEAGARLAGTGGARKLRVALPGKGRRGGVRVLYYFRPKQACIYLLFAYAKNDAANLSPRGKALIRRLVHHLKEEV